MNRQRVRPLIISEISIYMDSKQRYMMRGVSAMKEDVHNAIKNIDKGIFPQAFCKIIPDILGGDLE